MNYRVHERWIGKSGVMICLEGGHKNMSYEYLRRNAEDRERKGKQMGQESKENCRQNEIAHAGDLNAKNAVWGNCK